MRYSVPSVFRCAIVAAGLSAASLASAVPIAYEGSLTSGVTVGGFIRDPSLTGSPNDDFWSFSGAQGQQITLIGNRLDSGLDPAMRLYQGVANDTALLTFLVAADDNYPELPGFAGPFADPRIDITLPATGDYTVQMWDFASSAVPPGTDRCYQLTLNGEPTAQIFGCNNTVPEPSSASLLGVAIASLFGVWGLGAVRRRRPAA